MSKVKRWQAWVIADEVQRFQPVPEFFVSDEDHERIVAELKAEINGLKERLDVFRNREYEARNIEELKAEVEYLKASRERLALCELEALKRVEEKRQTIAKQAKVIERLSAVLEAVRSQMCWERDRDQLTIGMTSLHDDVTKALEEK